MATTMAALTVAAILMALCLGTAPANARARHHHHRHHHQSHLAAPQADEGAFNWFFGDTPPDARQTHRRPSYGLRRVMAEGAGRVVSHPAGCPRVAFCACGASVRVFGRPIRSLWSAASWFRFPRASPAPGKVAVRRHHVFVLEGHISGSVWRVFDANSGGHRTRIHPRSIAGYVIVDPRAGA